VTFSLFFVFEIVAVAAAAASNKAKKRLFCALFVVCCLRILCLLQLFNFFFSLELLMGKKV
jgi:hypothetical protein